jgi:hypothetical protein
MSQSYAHLKSLLWASPAARVYAVINAAVIPKLAERLKGADVKGWDCLWRGALPPEKAASAPYLAELIPESAFTDWLLKDAAATYPGWGVLAIGPLALMPMREHARRLLQVGLPDGSGRPWTWYDPVLWEALLPRLDPMQLDEAYGPVTDWVMVHPKVWKWMTFSAGQLVQTPRDCLPPSAT